MSGLICREVSVSDLSNNQAIKVQLELLSNLAQSIIFQVTQFDFFSDDRGFICGHEFILIEIYSTPLALLFPLHDFLMSLLLSFKFVY